ncbi:hypothetical protein ILUMI_19612 [Ignelater luminosus]|uniref:UDP-glucuronosyltransferase n=1 Tax=Ignelater luminosus TaxID=2038154 RepID=A0A8K0CJT8_IGNLU|nr:hypothetical protein ILUMI_19612 [Ignelater luminosus]
MWLISVIHSFVVMITSTYSYRILGIVPAPSYSHQIVFQPLWRELSLKGHKVTVLTTNPMNNPSLINLTEINLNSTYEIWNSSIITEMVNVSTWELYNKIIKLGYEVFDKQLQHSEVQDILVNKTDGFDLVLVETVFSSMIAFSKKLKCPLIQLFSLDGTSFNYHGIGNPSHPATHPDFLLPFSGRLTFFQRLISTAYLSFTYYIDTFHIAPFQELLVKRYFGKDYPSLNELLRTTSGIFVNTDNAFRETRPLLMSVAQIGGGIHMKLPKPLPKNLQNYLDNATNGAIYFSLGSNIKSKLLSDETRNILLETFSELPYTVFWKFEQDDLPGKPDNVIIYKWFPQQDVFRHPKIKLVISQGGLQSTEEALLSHIPIVGIPFIGDQHHNIHRLVQKGVGLSVDYSNINKKSLKNAILEVMNNPKYRERVKELATLARDEPMTGLERGVWWTEYIIRHRGAKHLRSPALDLHFYEYFCLDVISFMLLTSIGFIYIFFKSVKLSFNVIKSVLLKPAVN